MRFLLNRFFQSVVVLYIIATVVFFLMKAIPGGPFSQDREVSPAILKQLEIQYGLDEPVTVQYYKFLKNVTPKKLNLPALIQFDLRAGLGIDFGFSFRYEGRSVNQLIKDAFPISLELGFYAFVFACLTGIAFGILAAVNQNTRWDHMMMTTSMVGICIPGFVMGPLLILLVGFILPPHFRLPVLFWDSPSDANFWNCASHRILPTLTLGAYYSAGISRLMRASMLEVLSLDFVRTARAKGLNEAKVILKHGLKAGITPLVAYLGPVAANLLTGSFIVEYIFMLPGLGRHFVNAALNRDYTLLMGTVLLYAGFLVFFNFLADVAVLIINPKLKAQQA